MTQIQLFTDGATMNSKTVTPMRGYYLIQYNPLCETLTITEAHAPTGHRVSTNCGSMHIDLKAIASNKFRMENQEDYTLTPPLVIVSPMECDQRYYQVLGYFCADHPVYIGRSIYRVGSVRVLEGL